MSGYSADPKVIAALGEGFEDIGNWFKQIVDLGPDRLRLLAESCGDDDIGRQMKANLYATAAIIEHALMTIGTVIVNQAMVARGLATDLGNLENRNAGIVDQHTKRS